MALLRIVLAISGLLDAVAGIWFLAAGGDHPLMRWIALQAPGAEASGASTGLVFLSVFFALACFLGAALQAVALVWLMQDRDDAYIWINLYGVFALLAGIALFVAFSSEPPAWAGARGTAASAGLMKPWLGLVFVLIGALLLVVGNVVHLMPSTLRELRLPASSSRAGRRSEPAGEPRVRTAGGARRGRERPGRDRAARGRVGREGRERAGREGREQAGRGDLESRDRERPGREERPVARGEGRRPRTGRGTPERTAPREAAAPVAARGEPDRALSPEEAGRPPRRPRGRRSRRGGSSRRRGEAPVGQAIPGAPDAFTSVGEAGSGFGRLPSDREPREPRREPPELEAERIEAGERRGRGEAERDRRESRSRGRRGSGRPPRSESAEPRESRRGPAPPMSDEGEPRIGLVEGTPQSTSKVRILTPDRYTGVEAGRRPKKGRRSISGALFRPRERRRGYRHLRDAAEDGTGRSPERVPERRPEPPEPPEESSAESRDEN